jgi:rifampin ADP-ribosylating transferase
MSDVRQQANFFRYLEHTMTADWVPISYDTCHQVSGPFYHGTKAELAIGDLISTGFTSHFECDRALKHVYFSAMLEPAIWGAELAVALSGSDSPGYIYIIEPTGPFEDDRGCVKTQ